MALDFGAQEFVDLDKDALEDVGGVAKLPVGATLPGRTEQVLWASGARLSFRPRRAAPTRKLAAKRRGLPRSPAKHPRKRGWS